MTIIEKNPGKSLRNTWRMVMRIWSFVSAININTQVRQRNGCDITSRRPAEALRGVKIQRATGLAWPKDKGAAMAQKSIFLKTAETAELTGYPRTPKVEAFGLYAYAPDDLAVG